MTAGLRTDRRLLSAFHSRSRGAGRCPRDRLLFRLSSKPGQEFSGAFFLLAEEPMCCAQPLGQPFVAEDTGDKRLFPSDDPWATGCDGFEMGVTTPPAAPLCWGVSALGGLLVDLRGVKRSRGQGAAKGPTLPVCNTGDAAHTSLPLSVMNSHSFLS